MQRRLRIEPPRGERTPGGPLHLRVESRLIPLVERPRRPRAKRDRPVRGEAEHRLDMPDRKSVVWGKSGRVSVDLGGPCSIKKNTNEQRHKETMRDIQSATMHLIDH